MTAAMHSDIGARARPGPGSSAKRNVDWRGRMALAGPLPKDRLSPPTAEAISDLAMLRDEPRAVRQGVDTTARPALHATTTLAGMPGRGPGWAARANPGVTPGGPGRAPLDAPAVLGLGTRPAEPKPAQPQSPCPRAIVRTGHAPSAPPRCPGPARFHRRRASVRSLRWPAERWPMPPQPVAPGPRQPTDNKPFYGAQVPVGSEPRTTPRSFRSMRPLPQAGYGKGPGERLRTLRVACRTGSTTAEQAGQTQLGEGGHPDHASEDW